MTTTTIQADDVLTAIRDAYIGALKLGQHWHYVRVWPDGSITSGIEASPCCPESEYYSRGTPHPVTVWSMQSNWTPGYSDGVFAWEQCEEADAEFWADDDWQSGSNDRDDTHTIPCKLSSDLIDNHDFDEKEIRTRLEEAGYEVE